MDAAGRWVATTALEKNVRIWDQKTTRRVREIDDFRSNVKRLALSPDGSYLATASYRGVRLISLDE